MPVPFPMGRTLQARFLGQVRRLPAATQVLLLTAAADPTGDPALLWRAGQHLGFDSRAAGPVEAAELVTIGPTLAFRHPLVRSAIYHGATVLDRQRAHQALAEATDPVSGVDLSAWHRSEAATGPDEAIAMGLEQAAERARRRGGWSATGAYLTRSAVFTPDAAERLRRVLAAAQAESMAGAASRAQVLLDSVAGELRDPHQRIAAQRIQGAIHYALMQPAKTASILLDAARQIAPVDVGQARNALLDALAASLLSGRSQPRVPPTSTSRRPSDPSRNRRRRGASAICFSTRTRPCSSTAARLPHLRSAGLSTLCSKRRLSLPTCLPGRGSAAVPLVRSMTTAPCIHSRIGWRFRPETRGRCRPCLSP